MFRVLVSAVLLIVVGLAPAFSQGLTSPQTKDDWEEINFEFDSAILSDGYPSLLRLAELLQAHPDYRVRLEAHTDSRGSVRYNERLSARRGDEVKRFLVKYGASPNQVSIVAHGKSRPEVQNRTNEGRFINRRVTVTVTDGQGKTVSAAGIGQAIQAMQATEKPQPACCDEILKRLDKLDQILAAVQELKAENDRLKQDLASLQQAQAGLQKQVEGLPHPPERAELAQMMESEANKAIDKAKPSRFSLLELNLGPTLRDTMPFEGFVSSKAGNLSVSGRGRYFAPFGKTESHALQAEGEYRYYRDRQEGQFDIGLVNRYSAFQMGLFSSIKHVNLRDFAAGGTLGQAALTADYIFSRGRIGAFGTKGYLNESVLGRTPAALVGGVVVPANRWFDTTQFVTPGAVPRSFNILDETYLRIVDQLGASASIGAWNDAYFDANFGALFRRGGTNRPGGMVRLVQPLNSMWAVTVEAGLNETLVGARNTGRLAVGLQFGNWLRPKQYGEVKSPVPVDIPRLRYEVLTRRVRTGNSAPIADAGPDQTGVAAGTITLNGSGSYDPDGDPLTYQWDQIGGTAVSITGTTQAVATFPAAEGQTYIFRLTVKDTLGAQAVARTTVTTMAAPRVRILSFTASPAAIRAGDTSTLAWAVENAESVEISTLGGVDPRQGTATVAPLETTTYRLTARGRSGEVSQAVTVSVERPAARILSFQASPMNINAGQSSTLSWQTQDADSVSISGVGDVAQSGSASVSPTQTTTYTLTARNRFGQTSAVATVTVTPGTPPRIVTFAAAPLQIVAGQKSTLVWQVENATDVSIDTIGAVNAAGTRDVTPSATTTYTLKASNNNGQVTATTTVTVTQPVQPVQIGSFTANPAVSPAPNSPVTLTWTTTNATSASIAGIGNVPVNGSVTVTPATDTTYTLTAVGNGTQATSTVTVKVTQPTPPPPTGDAPVANAGQGFDTLIREITLNGTASKDPNNLPLTYSWRVVNNTASIVNPTSPTPSVILGQLFGNYTFELTVTNSKGLSSTSTVTVRLISIRVH